VTQEVPFADRYQAHDKVITMTSRQIRSSEPSSLQAASASAEGTACRAWGKTSVLNPYLRREALPANTGQDQATWFRNCDAWWRGWDAEDERLALAREAARH
jgi:hypothetical protein